MKQEQMFEVTWLQHHATVRDRLALHPAATKEVVPEAYRAVCREHHRTAKNIRENIFIYSASDNMGNPRGQATRQARDILKQI